MLQALLMHSLDKYVVTSSVAAKPCAFEHIDATFIWRLCREGRQVALHMMAF